MKELIQRLEAAPGDVITEVSEADEMYRPDRHDTYFEMGRSALRCIRLAMLTAGKGGLRSVLDFGCGHGRVLRMLKAEFPQAGLTACDINRDGVDFCERVFGASPIYSELEAMYVQIEDQFDLVWCGSLFTNLDLDRLYDFFALLIDAVAARGLFVFTTYGDWAASRMRSGAFDYGLNEDQIAELLREYDSEGFAYSDFPGQTLSGVSLISPAWIITRVARQSQLGLVGYYPRAWGDHQDVVACIGTTG